MDIDHLYETTIEWTGNRGLGTANYKAYGRESILSAPDHHEIESSSDRAFRGDPSRWNPEELLVAALSQCHMLSYLHEAAIAGVVVTAYSDVATGVMRQTNDGGGHFTSVTLNPVVTISAGDPDIARSLHRPANEKCFIAQSVNFPVHHAPTIHVEATDAYTVPTG
jgi:organic hydroperoxide reductase OsmC/OhrA